MIKKIIIIMGTFLIISILGIYLTNQLVVKSVKVINYDDSKMTIEIEVYNTLFNMEYECFINDNIVKSKNNICNISIPIEDNEFYLKGIFGKSKVNYISDYVSELSEFKFNNDTIYITVGEEKKINYSYIGLSKISFSFDTEIIKLENNTITGLKVGNTIIKENNSEKTMEVVVTDIISSPTLSQNKPVVPCNKYSDEDNILIDNILKYKVEEAGYQTRAGVVAAARFLTLEFPYKIPYFYENGRVSNTGVNFADGEGRYYHDGLYLSNSKKNELLYIVSGPATWGCPLLNWEDDEVYGYEWGTYKPNGLDCSGFVTWTLKNGGFDPGDIGAGESIYPNQITDLGKFTPLTNELINSDIIKAGDIFNYWGHVAIIIGIDDNNYYVAESLPDFGGVEVRIYNKNKVTKTFEYVVLMDDYYKKDGNYTKCFK